MITVSHLHIIHMVGKSVLRAVLPAVKPSTPSSLEVELKQYLTEALDKLELCQRKLTKANDERDKALQQSASLKVYVAELQKVL